MDDEGGDGEGLCSFSLFAGLAAHLLHLRTCDSQGICKMYVSDYKSDEDNGLFVLGVHSRLMGGRGIRKGVL